MTLYSRNSLSVGEAKSLPQFLKIPKHSDLNSKTKMHVEVLGTPVLLTLKLKVKELSRDTVHTTASKQSLDAMSPLSWHVALWQ